MAMKTTTPKSIQRRDRLVDSMAKKLADGVNVEKAITTHRRRRIKPMKYVYIAIALSVVSTSLTWLIMTGKVAPGLVNRKAEAPVEPVKNSLDLLNEDLAAKKINPDQYALQLRNCLNCYDSLPACYQTPRAGTTSDELFRALYGIWPQVSLRTRAHLLKMMPYLERKWEKYRFEQQE
ncbi:MAG: hypothetical protein JW913_03935 [Chitinispirillaceae bacterium]|nr:hypothetical protein [Chitinispirillaceae bacterium]